MTRDGLFQSLRTRVRARARDPKISSVLAAPSSRFFLFSPARRSTGPTYASESRLRRLGNDVISARQRYRERTRAQTFLSDRIARVSRLSFSSDAEKVACRSGGAGWLRDPRAISSSRRVPLDYSDPPSIRLAAPRRLRPATSLSPSQV